MINNFSDFIACMLVINRNVNSKNNNNNIKFWAKLRMIWFFYYSYVFVCLSLKIKFGVERLTKRYNWDHMEFNECFKMNVNLTNTWVFLWEIGKNLKFSEMFVKLVKYFTFHKNDTKIDTDTNIKKIIYHCNKTNTLR